MSGLPRPRILIVDDDAVTRLFLRKLLGTEPGWELLEADDGLSAWQLIESGQPVDLCISDLQMPQLDGIGLLKKIRASECCKAMKVILCTSLRDRKTIETVASFHVNYYLLKPFKKEVILGQIRQALAGKPEPERAAPPVFVKGDLTIFLRRAQTPVSLPVVYQELVQTLGRPDSSIRQISDIILRDQGLTCRLLKLANSAFYGNRAEIDTVEAAAQIVGLGQIQELMLSTSLIKSFEGLPSSLVDVNTFWEHSVVCALASELLAQYHGDPIPERMFIAGLLHDFGRLVLYLNAPDQSRTVLERCAQEGALACPVERDVLGFDHAEVAAELMSSWGLPRPLVECVRLHHQPPKSASASRDAFILHLADFLTSALQFGSSGELYLSPLVLPPYIDPAKFEEYPMDNLITELEQRAAALVPRVLERQDGRARSGSEARKPEMMEDEPGRRRPSTLLPMDQLRPLMVLAADVVTPDGQVLLPQGTSLKAEHLASLRSNQVASASVRSNAVPEPTFPPEILAAAEESVQDHWRYLPNLSPALQTVRKHAVRRVAAWHVGQAQTQGGQTN